jgi:type IV pilus assembly protein PilM
LTRKKIQMTYQTEPAYIHGTPEKTGILLVNLGTPDAPTPDAVRTYLKEFLSDPRVVEMPKLPLHELAQALPFEAQRSLPFSIQDVVLDGVILGPSEGNKMWVLVVACKKELLERRIDWLKQAELAAVGIDVDALAVANAFMEQTGNSRKPIGTHALINVGAQWTNLIVMKEHIPYLIRDIPWGAGKLIRHVAESLKCEETAVAPALTQSGALQPEWTAALKTGCESLVADLQLSFDFFENRFGTPPERVMVSGGLGQCAGFVEALKPSLAQPCAAWEPKPGLGGQFTVAYGLALRAP